MDQIDLLKIRGKWEEWGDIADLGGGLRARGPIAGGDDTITSIELVAQKVNEIVEWINEQHTKE